MFLYLIGAWQGHGHLTGLDNGSHPDPPRVGSRWAVPKQNRIILRPSLHCLKAEAGICFLLPRVFLSTSSGSLKR